VAAITLALVTGTFAAGVDEALVAGTDVPGWAAVPGVAPGAAGTDEGATCAAGGTTGALCFCHASQSMSAEKEKMTRAMRRWVSIMGSGPSGNRVEAAATPGVAAQHAPEREP